MPELRENIESRLRGVEVLALKLLLSDNRDLSAMLRALHFVDAVKQVFVDR